MKYRKLLTILAVLTVAGAQLIGHHAVADDDDDDKKRRGAEHHYILLIGANGGGGFCEFVRKGRKVQARLWVAGAIDTFDPTDITNKFVTAWQSINGAAPTYLDGTVATGTGEADLAGKIKLRRGTTTVKLIAFKHQSVIQDITNDADLTKELTTSQGILGGSDSLGDCSIEFDVGRKKDRDDDDDD